MRMFLAALLVMVCLVPARAQTWKPYTSTAGRFTIDAPGVPELLVEKNETPLGTIEENSVRWRLPGREWLVHYSDVPDAATTFNGNILFSQVRRGFQRSTGMPISNEKPWKLHDNPGRSFDFSFKGGERFGQGRSLLVGLRLYIITVTWEKSPQPPEDAARFLQSFSLLSPG